MLTASAGTIIAGASPLMSVVDQQGVNPALVSNFGKLDVSTVTFKKSKTTLVIL